MRLADGSFTVIFTRRAADRAGLAGYQKHGLMPVSRFCPPGAFDDVSDRASQ
jgi:hypothetical protein